MQSQEVKTITDADDAIDLSDEEKKLLNQANGQVLLFYLSGPMIFGVAKAIAREHSAMGNVGAIILDLTDVPMLGVTACLAIENMVLEALEQGRVVYIVGAAGSTHNRLQKFGVLDRLPLDHLVSERRLALAKALVELNIPVSHSLVGSGEKVLHS